MHNTSKVVLTIGPCCSAEVFPVGMAFRGSDTAAQDNPAFDPGNTHWQRFSVLCDYSIAFTKKLFSPQNPLLADIVTLRAAGKCHRCLVYVDDDLIKVQPDILERIHTYFVANSIRVSLLGDPMVVPSGGQITQCSSYMESVEKAIHRLSADQPACVIAIGGGAMLEAIGVAVAHSGIRHIRIPSTVLSQDS